MPRVVSFIVLLAILLLTSAVFFQVMAHFVVPLFLAAVLVVVFKPLHEWVVMRLPGYPRIAALATTMLILLAVLLPTVWLGWKAAVELRGVYSTLNPAVAASTEIAATAAAAPELDKFLEKIVQRAPEPLREFYTAATGSPFDKEAIRPLYIRARSVIGAIAVSGLQIALKLLFGLAIMVLALYYFLADGPKMLSNLMKMSPLDDEYERELLDKFANVSRAVVVASLASAVAQGLLAGIGYYFALDPGAPVFLLTMLTMVLAIVPFAGAAAVWVPTAAWIYLYQPVLKEGEPALDAMGHAVQGDPFTAICLAIYGACVVSAIDNLIKPMVLHGQSNLHPLLALISILGGVQTLGPIGILVGPMLVAFIQALVNMVNKELHRLGNDTLDAKHGARATPLPLETAGTPLETEAAPPGGAGMIERLLRPEARAAGAGGAAGGKSPDPGLSRRRRRRR
ncbi:MAG TPA: AI-2E family transporter [Lacipirellulaceae bacterium]|nr:AI-2E family transporter [Lacipirellulaceae bacterium]